MSGGTWIGLDRGDADVAAAEHLAAEIIGTFGLAVSAACTHLVGAPHGHVAVSLAVEGELAIDEVASLLGGATARGVAVSVDGERLVFGGAGEFIDGALEAAAAHHDGTSGRAFRYHGEAALRGRLRVHELLARSAIARVEGLPGPVGGEAAVETRDHVRPSYRDGILTLLTTPRADGSVQPFESPTPHECSGGPCGTLGIAAVEALAIALDVAIARAGAEPGRVVAAVLDSPGPASADGVISLPLRPTVGSRGACPVLDVDHHCKLSAQALPPRPALWEIGSRAVAVRLPCCPPDLVGGAPAPPTHLDGPGALAPSCEPPAQGRPEPDAEDAEQRHWATCSGSATSSVAHFSRQSPCSRPSSLARSSSC